MVIKKEDTKGVLGNEHENTVKKLEKIIDDKITRIYSGTKIRITLGETPHKKIQLELKRRYKQANWILRCYNDEHLFYITLE